MKGKLMTLALMGILFGTVHAEETMNPEMQSFYEKLDTRGKERFLELDTKHRQAAMTIVQQYCGSAQGCKGVREKAVEQQYQLQQLGK